MKDYKSLSATVTTGVTLVNSIKGRGVNWLHFAIQI